MAWDERIGRRGCAPAEQCCTSHPSSSESDEGCGRQLIRPHPSRALGGVHSGSVWTPTRSGTRRRGIWNPPSKWCSVSRAVHWYRARSPRVMTRLSLSSRTTSRTAASLSRSELSAGTRNRYREVHAARCRTRQENPRSSGGFILLGYLDSNQGQLIELGTTFWPAREPYSLGDQSTSYFHDTRCHALIRLHTCPASRNLPRTVPPALVRRSHTSGG